MDIEWPHFRKDGRRDRRGSSSAAFETVAANLLPEYMQMPVIPAGFDTTGHVRIAPEWLPMTVTNEHYQGEICSLDVPGPRHYVSGGAVVHNSRRGDWNPLQPHGKGITSANRLLNYLRVSHDGRTWRGAELKAWVTALKQAGVIRKGYKTAIENLDDVAPVDIGWVTDRLEDEAVEAAMDGNLDWFREHLLAAREQAGFLI